jgi:hypothetical protein
MSVISKIERVPLREVWPHEACGLTRWLEENVGVLEDVVRLGLVTPEREQAAGAFSVGRRRQLKPATPQAATQKRGREREPANHPPQPKAGAG